MNRYFVHTLATLALAAAGTAPALAAHEGDVAPRISIPGGKPGTTLDVQKFRGKPVYVNFFASWCPPCNAEAPSVKGLAAKYKQRGLVTVGIDESENPATAVAFSKKFGWPFPVGSDGDGAIASDLRSPGLPIHLFIDRSGKISTFRIGEMAPSEIEEAIKKML